MPPSLCADMVFFLEDKKSPRDAYRVLSKYLDVPTPNVIINTELVERYNLRKYGDPLHSNGYYSRTTMIVHLRNDYITRTAIHEFFHHFSNIRNRRYEEEDVWAYAKEVIRRARLILRRTLPPSVSKE